MRAMSSASGTPQRQSALFLRRTRQRKAIEDALRQAGGFLTAQDIHDSLKTEGGRVGLTTVYRTLQALAEAGEIDMVRSGGGETLYRRCIREDHHHHLVCRSCGASVEIHSPEVERWAESLADQHGFAEVTHTLEVYGLCESCPP